MNNSEFFKLQIGLDPQTYWSLLPTWIPGEIEEIDPKYSKGCYVQPLINLVYPTGEPITHLKCSNREGLEKGALIEFTHKPASEKERKQSQRPDLLQVDRLRQCSREQIQKSQQVYQEEITAKILAKLPPEIEVQIQALNAEFDTQIRHALEVRISELDKKDKALEKIKNKVKEEREEIGQSKALLEHERQQLELARSQFEEVQGPAYRLYELFKQDGKAALNPRKDLSDQRSPLRAGQEFLPKLKDSLMKVGYLTLNEAVLRQFVTASLTACLHGDLVLLTGPTGVGKTGMVEKVAHAIGAGSSILPVRPAWTDPGDLLGFYNSLSGVYQTTPFLENLLVAQEYLQASRLFFICLDEMNLARVENYAADLLSRLEKSREGGAKLKLLSDDIWAALELEYRHLGIQADQLNPAEVRRFQLLRAQLDKFKADISIPENLVIYGTLNMDESVPMPSPKTLDRSYVIQFPSIDLSQVNGTGRGINRLPGAEPDGYLDYGVLVELSRQAVLPIIADEAAKFWRLIVQWEQPYLKPLGATLGYRFAHAYNRYIQVGSALLGIDVPHLATDFVKLKLLPRVNFLKDAPCNDSSTKIEVWEDWRSNDSIDEFPELESELNAIEQNNRHRVVIQYWV